MRLEDGRRALALGADEGSGLAQLGVLDVGVGQRAFGAVPPFHPLVVAGLRQRGAIQQRCVGIVTGADHGQVQRRIGQFPVDQQDAGLGQSLQRDGGLGQISQRVLGHGAQRGVAAVVHQQIGVSRQGDILLDAGDRRDRRVTLDRGRIAQVQFEAFDWPHRFVCTLQPGAFAAGPVQRQKGATHAQRVAQIRSRGIIGIIGIVGIVGIVAVRAQPFANRPVRGLARRRECRRVAGGFCQRRQTLDHGAGFAGIDLWRNAWHPERPPPAVVQCEVLGAVLAGAQVGILTGAVAAGRVAQEARRVVTHAASRGAEFGFTQLGAAQRVDAQIVALQSRQLFEMRVLPVAVGGVLIKAAPDRVEQ